MEEKLAESDRVANHLNGQPRQDYSTVTNTQIFNA